MIHLIGSVLTVTLSRLTGRAVLNSSSVGMVTVLTAMWGALRSLPYPALMSLGRDFLSVTPGAPLPSRLLNNPAVVSGMSRISSSWRDAAWLATNANAIRSGINLAFMLQLFVRSAVTWVLIGGVILPLIPALLSIVGSFTGLTFGFVKPVLSWVFPKVSWLLVSLGNFLLASMQKSSDFLGDSSTAIVHGTAWAGLLFLGAAFLSHLSLIAQSPVVAQFLPV